MHVPAWRRAALWLALAWIPSAFPAAAVPRFRHVTIDPAIAIGYGLAVADIDGDRRPDIVLADKHVIAWYRNPDCSAKPTGPGTARSAIPISSTAMPWPAAISWGWAPIRSSRAGAR